MEQKQANMDYKDLLIKYIAHIIDNEGIDYTDRNINGPVSSVTISDQEQAELEALAKEAREKYKS
jgi:hypothetical protein